CPKCGKPLLARYDLESVKKSLGRDDLIERVASLWRYRELLPVREDANIVSLGEGYTPLIHAARSGARLGMERLFIKDEGLNPTGSFKARGLCMAISRAKELGVTEVVIPSAGNAAGAMSAYAARAGMKAHVFMPSDVPLPFRLECAAYGADVHLIDGLITDCGREAHAQAEKNRWFDVSTIKEPYRVEGKKTMGYELAEQFNWILPDVVIYPTGGGTGLIGMWKAFDEMRELGWIDGVLPRMVCVQADGCAPIPRALAAGDEFASPWEDAHTVAAGLRVPQAIGDFLILRAIRESNGTAIAVSDNALIVSQRAMATEEGIFACPEGGATLAALENLLNSGAIARNETVVLFNTGTGLKYP
ncbi:MAG TPA: threonine synthase, partial [Candidatus Acetothermia bacterium]|nr:threonine synthase [Candidatus Acetothermia bacterium]